VELKLENGQYVTAGSGIPERVEGTEELLQRARMRLTARRGSFYPDPDYGSRLYQLGALKPSQRSAAAKLYAAEALQPERELSVGTVTYTPGADDSATVTVELLYGNGATELTFTI
jgi:phage gp46-like protein